MASLNRYRVLWSGGPGGEGVSTFYEADAVDLGALVDLHAFFDSVKFAFPNAFSWRVQPAGDSILDTTGQLDGSYSGTAPAVVTGSNLQAAYAAGVGVMIRWETAGIAGGRRVRGRTFLTGISQTNYQSDGSVYNDTVTSIQAAVDTLVAAGWLTVWSRPFEGDANHASRDGSSHLVTSGTVVDKVTWLRTRRD